ncbi:DUF4173 domain-containing protein [Winogradskyella sp. SYSU M77433]|uniref:DUF4153 domain-containing protein n=1 Tax=Winogradskyella sp. SYSU M77433 TaxID=3042722 RepID=UPI002480271F|nr:DUF4173 domain-containing protein [Winogradskyella sp. SYSU M77433]MDH7913196.1 DUF4173 domain-containing protein [Winogradskyella sp. SYSU M77433]
MKKLFLFIGALLFSTLFYDKSIGLNLFLFSITTVTILFLNNKKDFENTRTLIYGTIYIITGVAVFFHDSSVAILANCICFFTLIGLLSENKSSIYVNWLNGLYTTIAGLFHRNFSVNEKTQTVEPKHKIDYIHLLKIIFIPLVFVIIFIALYKDGNPFFSDIISKIDFSFINIQWILFAGLGYYLFANIHKPVEVEPATELDLTTGNSLEKTAKFSLPKLKQENQLGVVLISVLNALIVLFLITDISFLFSSMDIRASVFSAQVHSGINALIASILIAIVILLYVFRGDLNFFAENKTLKKLAFTWITLNMILVLSIMMKNGQYIYYFGLTYKRIGVLIYLILVVTGLITTLLKISKIKNIWYLLRLNTKAAFVVLIIAATINWDYHITNYNFNYAKSMDVGYLIELSNNNALILKDQSEQKELGDFFLNQIEEKYRNYVYELRTNSWQELQYDNLKIDSE